MTIDLRPWQRRFVRRALAPGVRTSALSLPRGNGKSTLVASLARRALTPGDELFVPGAESHIASSTIGQARRSVFKLLREQTGDAPGYRIAETQNACHIIHEATNTRVSVLPCNGKSIQGLVRCPWVFVDEPGSMDQNAGDLLHSAIQTGQGKPGSELRAVYIGTVAPARPDSWWPAMIAAGTRPGVYVQRLLGDLEKWDTAAEIKKMNPLMWTFPASRAVLLDERDKARTDPRLKAEFCSYRLNAPVGDESTMLLTVAAWDLVCGRDLPDADGAPVVGVDLGGGRSWSAAVALWRSGRMEALACAPGLPSLRDQEVRDGVPRRLYEGLAASGSLRVATGLRVQPPAQLIEAVTEAWGRPQVIVCDRFRLGELLDVVGSIPVVPRVSRWSESSSDIRSLRRMALDGPLACAPSSRSLLTASLSAAMVLNDDAGNVRLRKKGFNSKARDDVAAALVLGAGALSRAPAPSRAGRLLIAG